MVKKLLDEGYVVGVVSRTNIDLSYPKAQVINLDILDFPALHRKFSDFQPSITFHLAGIRPEGVSWSSVQQAYQTNLWGTMNVLKGLKDTACWSVVVMGSGAEYGQGDTPFREYQPLFPSTPYGSSKAAATQLAAVCQQMFDLPITVIRPTLVYGPGQAKYLFLHQLISSLISDTPFSMTAGEQYRDFIYVTDVVEAILMAATTTRAMGGIYNVGNGVSFPLKEVAEKIAAMVGKEDLLRIGSLPYAAGEQFNYSVDISRARQFLNWSPKVDFSEGLQRTLNWYLERSNEKH